MSDDIKAETETDNEPIASMNEADEETGSLLLTADCCEGPPAVPRLKVKTSRKTPLPTQKKGTAILKLASVFLCEVVKNCVCSNDVAYTCKR